MESSDCTPDNNMLRVLHVSNMWPTENAPHFGSFVKSQVTSLAKAGVLCESVYAEATGVAKYSEIRSKLKNQIVQFKPNIVHAHFGWTGAAVVDICKHHDIPLVISYCGGDINGEKGTLARRLKHQLGIYLSLWAGRSASLLIVKNKDMMTILPARLQSKTILLPNGVDTKLFTPMKKNEVRKELGWKNGPIALFAGRSDDPTKNFDLAKQAINIAQHQIPDLTLKTPKNIPHNMMPTLLNAADILLMTSYKEGSPNIVKEALSCDLPVISVPVGDVPWILNDLRSCAVTAYDANEIAQNTLTLIDGSVAQGERRQRILDYKLDSQSIAHKLILAYKGLLS